MDTNKTNLMLKYQKAKVKLLEYDIPESHWPYFPLNYKDLAFPTVLFISKYAEAINEHAETKNDDEITYKTLSKCSEFYDAALQSREQKIHDADFALSGAAAFFLIDDFGSSKVLWNYVCEEELVDDIQKTLYDVLSLAFLGKVINGDGNSITQAIISFWKDGDRDALEQILDSYRNSAFDTNFPHIWYWGEIICAVARRIGDASARILLPAYSDIDIKAWDAYFKRSNAINILWPSQRLVCKSNLLRGKNAIVQLPTGVGKTKSIEIIIWSMFLSKRGKKALIVAPLRSLCNEIIHDVRSSFPMEISINQFSDLMEDDFFNVLLRRNEKQILVCTPEKLQYIFHHDRSFIKEIDLYVFDESHMFDDRSRGALYELLLTDIKLGINENQQLLLMSAVLPNAHQIVRWLFGKNGVLAYDPNIKTTPKSVGFIDRNQQVHYYSSADSDEDFFVPHTINPQRLQLMGKERTARLFPNNSRDNALYYANILCKTGGIAIYFNQRRSIPKLFERIEDINRRGYHLSNIQEMANAEELLRFKRLFEAYYGKDYVYTKTVNYGVLPHYSSLPNGIKVSTEYALRKNKVKVVACTSTLAQGVNIPIKYLLITGTTFSDNQMSVRDFQNLIGRTGRSGVYTEGDVIVTNTKLYDERKQRGRGYYQWKDARRLFDASAVEECGSSILHIVQNFRIAYSNELHGSSITQYICENIYDDWSKKLLPVALDEIRQKNVSFDIVSCRRELSERFINYKITIDAIENEMMYLLSYQSSGTSSELLQEIKETLMINSLAYYLATEEEKKLLTQLYDAIADKVNNKLYAVSRYSHSMISIEDAELILEWIQNNSINTEKKKTKDLLSLIEEFFGHVYRSLSVETGFVIAWVRGDSYEKMSRDFDLKMQDVEKICNYNVSYHMSFFVGNIIDLVEANCVNKDALQLIQQALRYGVNSKTEISICEKVFNDRYLAKTIATIIGFKEISTEEIVQSIKIRYNSIYTMLKNYPSFFVSVIEGL